MRSLWVALRFEFVIAVSQIIAGIFSAPVSSAADVSDGIMHESMFPLCTLHTRAWLDKDWPYGQTNEYHEGNEHGERRQEYPLRLLVLTYRRANSLVRLLNSLENGNYSGDSVALDIFIDRYVLNFMCDCISWRA
jgi:hypothetical protein